MLTLKNITKTYQTGTVRLGALNDVTLSFRKSEFVSILGPSGCGKTTMLNIVGGLDRYTSGDLIIDGRSTKNYTDKDWDTYRNHKVGFVFQSYNLIPHQTVLQNVELALTLSGIGKKERRERAIEALTKVGLADKIKNRPNQLSGGQMQRVAIARALVNDPEIVLADEPTGALDTESSVQIMELLKEISKDKLIVMVTHNPELAEKYSTRIVRLLDGRVQSDTMPFDGKLEEAPKKDVAYEDPKSKKKRMSFFTAMGLSFKNLLTKKARTLLVAFAGSIGIIGIALILAISSGFSGYVDKMQKDTLSTYPVSISNKAYDMNSLMQVFFSSTTNQEAVGTDKVYTKNELTTMLQKFNTSSASNDLKSFKTYLEGDGKAQIEPVTTAIQYVYNVGVNAYYNSAENGLVAINPSTVFADKITAYPLTHPLTTQDQQTRYGLLNMMFGSKSSFYSNEFWSEMINNQTFLEEQYDLVGAGSEWADSANEVMIIVDENNQITDYTLFGLGLLNQNQLDALLDAYINNTQEINQIGASFEFNDLLGLTYKLILDYEYFELQSDGTYLDIRTLQKTNPSVYAQKIANLYADSNVGIEISVSGIIKPKENVTSTSISTVVGYTQALTNLLAEKASQSALVQSQMANQTTNVLTNQPFVTSGEVSVKAQYEGVLSSLGYVDLSSPEEINIYPTKFEDKEVISSIITNYNTQVLADGEDDKVISYTDTVGTMMASISLIISAITYVLIAFVGVSLVVSSIMIGIITYISVIERTKEIGVLRSVGASKKDVKRVFTAESFIIGLSSGVFGIIISLLLIIPINILLAHFTGISGMANLPILGAAILVLVSVVLTFIAGLIPARVAAKKDPVIALRAE